MQDVFLERRHISCSDRLNVGYEEGKEKRRLTMSSWIEQLRGWMVGLPNNMGDYFCGQNTFQEEKQ